MVIKVAMIVHEGQFPTPQCLSQNFRDSVNCWGNSRKLSWFFFVSVSVVSIFCSHVYMSRWSAELQELMATGDLLCWVI